jgi:lysophospholipase L1-like esterase
MKKKRLLIFLAAIIIVLSVGYLLLAHHYIYYVIGKAKLSAPDKIYHYSIGGNSGSAKIIYSAIGDSLTAGVGTTDYRDSYVYRLSESITSSSDAGIDLRVQAYPGARTADVIRDLLDGAINVHPDIATVLLGVNDIHGFVSAKKFTANYDLILRRLKTETSAKVYAISIPYVGADNLLLFPYNIYFDWKTVEYNKIIKKLAVAEDVVYIDLYAPARKMYENPLMYAADRFHPSALGYEFWAKIIYDNINN